MAWLVALAVLVDAASTILGLSLGLPEAGPVASRLLPVLGVAYWGLEAAVLYGLAWLLERRGLARHWAGLAAATGPWLAGWSNLGVIARHAGVL